MIEPNVKSSAQDEFTTMATGQTSRLVRQCSGRDAEECSRDQLHPGWAKLAEPELSNRQKSGAALFSERSLTSSAQLYQYSVNARTAMVRDRRQFSRVFAGMLPHD